MRSVDIETLKHKLSEYVRIAAAGETVLVTTLEKILEDLDASREDRFNPAAWSTSTRAVAMLELIDPIVGRAAEL